VPVSAILQNVSPPIEMFQPSQNTIADSASHAIVQDSDESLSQISDIIDLEYTAKQVRLIEEGCSSVAFEACCNLPEDDPEPLRCVFPPINELSSFTELTRKELENASMIDNCVDGDHYLSDQEIKFVNEQNDVLSIFMSMSLA